MNDKLKGFGSGCGLTEVLSRHFLGGTEEDHTKPQSTYLVTRQRSDQSTLGTEAKSDTATASHSVPRVKCGQGVTQFRYLGTRVTNQNLIQEEIKRRMNSGNACYHSVQNCLTSRLLSKNIKIRK
jgi:hypothetical protein